MSKYVIKLEDEPQASPLIDEDGIITRQGRNILHEIEQYGYYVELEKVEDDKMGGKK